MKNDQSDTKKIRGTSAVTFQDGHDPLHGIVQLIESGEEPKRVFAAIAEASLQLTGATGTALFLPIDDLPEDTPLATDGDFVPERAVTETQAHSQRIAIHSMGTFVLLTAYESVNYYTLNVNQVGVVTGTLVVHVAGQLTHTTLEKLCVLTHHAGMIFERQKLTGTVQHFLDRLQVLNQLNSLIASNAGTSAILKNISRESAFRFAADVSLTLVLNEDKTVLDIMKGAAYGCAPTSVPGTVSITNGTLSQVMHLGGHFSVPNLQGQINHGLGFLEQLGIQSVDIQCLEVRGDPLGALILGFKREHTFQKDELNAFREFCQGSAVAIANARTQERITAYTERLKELVESRTKDLERQTKIAEEANMAKSRFLANMSHELRTPLTAIIGYSSVLKDGLFGPLNDKQRDALTAITRSSEHLKNLIDDVLNLARVESGKEQPEPKVISVKDILEQSYKLMMQSALGKGITLEQPKFTEDQAGLGIFADHKHTQQIIINLMSNAVKYTPRGGRVWLTTEVVADKVRIGVNDTGVGIPPHKQETLFQRFERGDDNYSKTQEGTGIGLNLTKHLIEINGGRIGVESTQGQGSIFWIVLPIANCKAESTIPENDEISQIELTGLSALIVDDNDDTCEVLKAVLCAAGVTVQIAHNVQEGVAALNVAIPDIVLTDLALPFESGVNLIAHIRNSVGDLSTLPVLVLSACAFPADREAALQAGASIFIPKPFRPSEVLRTVRELTFTRALRQ